jgi:2-methylisocitrate lyase-like PEP mutase family enzyme
MRKEKPVGTSDPSGRIRKRLGVGFVESALVYDGLSAKLAETAGFECVYLSGASVSASRGFPDVGLVTMSEMLDAVRQITYAVDIPMLCDADTGYGNAINAQRTVREFERAGAAGVHLEDQEFPKKCGFLAGKRVVPLEEHANKIRAACDARASEDFVIIGRTDALASEGWPGVVERAEAYVEAGADLIMVDGIRNADVGDYVTNLVAREVPCVFNGQLISGTEAQRLGFRLHLMASAVRAAYEAMYRLFHEARGVVPPAELPHLFDALGLQDVYALEARYTDRSLPEATDIHTLR